MFTTNKVAKKTGEKALDAGLQLFDNALAKFNEAQTLLDAEIESAKVELEKIQATVVAKESARERAQRLINKITNLIA